MTYHAFRAPYKKIRLQVEHKPIVEGMRGFGGASDTWKFVKRLAAPACMIEGCGLRPVVMLKVKNRATQLFCDQFAFCNTVGRGK